MQEKVKTCRNECLTHSKSVVGRKVQKNLLMAPGVLSAIKHKQVSLAGAG